MMHWQTNDAVGHFVCNRQVLLGCTGQTAVGGEFTDEGIEIPPSQYTLLLHLEIEIIAAHAKFLLIHEDGEVTVVVAYAGDIFPDFDAFYITEGFTVADGNLMAGLDGCIHLAQVEETVGTAYLIWN